MFEIEIIDGKAVITLTPDAAIKLHDILRSTWFPTQHPHLDDTDVEFADSIADQIIVR